MITGRTGHVCQCQLASGLFYWITVCVSILFCSIESDLFYRTAWFLLINVFFFVLPCPFFNCFSVMEVILFSSSSKVFLFLLPSLCKQSLLCRSTLPFSSLTLLFCSIPSSNRSPLHFNGTFFRTPALLPINFFLARSSFLHTAPSVESGCVSALLPNQRLLFTFCPGFDSKSSCRTLFLKQKENFSHARLDWLKCFFEKLQEFFAAPSQQKLFVF